jgi:arsenate reductase-like glutaredoxin family protein
MYIRPQIKLRIIETNKREIERIYGEKGISNLKLRKLNSRVESGFRSLFRTTNNEFRHSSVFTMIISDAFLEDKLKELQTTIKDSSKQNLE